MAEKQCNPALNHAQAVNVETGYGVSIELIRYSKTPAGCPVTSEKLDECLLTEIAASDETAFEAFAAMTLGARNLLRSRGQ